MAKHRGKRKRRRYPMRNRHHILPKSRKGGNEQENILLLRVQRHDAWHYLFGDKTIEAAIALLFRVHRAKGRCTGKLARCLLEVRHDNRRQASYSTQVALSSTVRGVHRKRDIDVSLRRR